MEREKRGGANKRPIERKKKKPDLEATPTSRETAQLHPRLPRDAPAILPPPPFRKKQNRPRASP